MTPYELYQFYLNKYRNPEGSSLVKQEVQPTYTLPEVLPVSETGGDETTTGPTSTGKGVGNISMSDIGKAIGFAINPALGIVSLGFNAVTGKTPMQAVQDTLASMGIGTAATGPTAPGAGMGFGGGYATDVGFGGMGTSPSGVDQGLGPGGCATGTSGPSTDTGMGPGGCDPGGGDGGNGGSGAGGADAGSGPGGCSYAKGGRVGYAAGTLLPPKPGTIGYIDPATSPNIMGYTNFLDYLKGRTEGTYNDAGSYIPYYNYYREITPDTSLFGKYKNSAIPENVSELYDQYLNQARQFRNSPDIEKYKVQGELPDGTWYESYRLPSSTANQTPTKDTSSNLAAGLYQTTNPNIIGYSPSEPAITALPRVQETDKTLAETLFPQGDFLNIRETATSPTEYNIQATKDLVENLPGGIVKDIVAPAAAGIMSIPYDAIQAYQRMQPGSGLGGFAKAYAAERPLRSAFERFVGASGPLAENINKAVSSLSPFQQQQYMQYATQNPEQARAAAQRNQEFIQATQRENQATGGRIGYASGSDKIDYWITVQEMYDNAGGEAGTGLGLIDFANKYFPKMADGGRPGYLQGGLVSLLR